MANKKKATATDERTEFVGFYTTKAVKDSLRRDAAEYGRSISRHLHHVVKDQVTQLTAVYEATK